MFLEAAVTLTGWQYVLNIFMLVVGLIILVKGADFFVSGASSVAKKLKISSLVIGLTVVSFGTSAPELAVSLSDSLATQGQSTIAMGNIIGSNIVNILVVLGLSAIISPIIINKGIVKRDIPVLILTTVMLIVFSLDNFLGGFNGAQNIISRAEGIVFIIGIVYYVYTLIKQNRNIAKEGIIITSEIDNENVIEPLDEIKEYSLRKSLIFLIGGLASIILAANFLITDPARKIAESIGVSMGLDPINVVTFVGLTVVAIGTSLPELVTSLIAAKKGENEIAIGNVVGSNIFNILLICGMCGVFTTLPLSREIITDIFISLGITFLLLYFCFKGKISRKNGAILISLYVVYLAYIMVRVFYPNLVIPV